MCICFTNFLTAFDILELHFETACDFICFLFNKIINLLQKFGYSGKKRVSGTQERLDFMPFLDRVYFVGVSVFLPGTVAIQLKVYILVNFGNSLEK